MTRVAALSAALAVLFTLVPAAAAATVQEIASSLARDPVYVDQGADPTLTEAEADDLRSAIATSEARPIFVAVVGSDALDETRGDPQVLAGRIADAVGAAGTYAIVADGRFRTASRGVYADRTVSRAAEQAVAQDRSDGAAAVLLAFVRRLGAAQRGEGGLPSGPDPAVGLPADPGSTLNDGGGFAVVGLGGLLVPLLLVGGGFLLARRLLRRRALEPGVLTPDVPPSAGIPRAFADVRALAEQDVLDLGSDIYELDPVVRAAGTPRAAIEEFRRAVGHYDRAQELLGAVHEADDLAPVTEAIEEGRYALAATRARLAGEDLPERRVPCFFDPRHGPSTTDVEWAPPGGAPRLVPACAMDADRIRQGASPAARELLVDGEQIPYWDAPVRYRGWAGGWFGGFGGPTLLGGLLLGGLGGMFAGEMLGLDEADDAADDAWGGDIGGGDRSAGEP